MEFEWDNGNLLKNLIKHGVSREESEQVFVNGYVLRLDEAHSLSEVRFEIIGVTDNKKILFVAFTTRGNKVRIVSARPASKNERGLYEQKT